MTKIAPEILNIIANSTTDGEKFFLPASPRLEPKTYQKVNKVLESLGGKWNRKSQAHLFDGDAGAAREEIVLTGAYTDRKKEFQFFETPIELVSRLVELAEITDPLMHILEPSAGRGRIIAGLKAFPNLFYCELDPDNHEYLEKHCPYASFMGGDFLEHPTDVQYDRIVANPPFTRQQDIRHVTHMIDCLNPGGIVVSVMSSSITFRDDPRTKTFRQLLDLYNATIEELPEGTFRESGTMVNTVIVKLQKEHD